MKLLNRQTLVKDVFEKWMKQYPNDKEGIGKKLKRLGKTPNPDKVDEIIGNDSWTRVKRCSECQIEKDEVVEIGQEPDYESYTAYICRECLDKAISLMGG